MAGKETLWCRQILKELSREQTYPTKLNVDNQVAIELIINSQLHARTKHIDISFMFVREVRQRKWIKTCYVLSESQFADYLTKALPREKHLLLVQTSGCMPL